MAKDKAKKPKGWRAFDGLTRRLIRVPKEEAERKIEESKRKKK